MTFRELLFVKWLIPQQADLHYLLTIFRVSWLLVAESFEPLPALLLLPLLAGEKLRQLVKLAIQLGLLGGMHSTEV